MFESLLGFSIGWIFMSGVEYASHRWTMHKWSFMDYISPGTFADHAYKHHGKYYKVFNAEEDPIGRDFGLLLGYRWALIVSMLLMAICKYCNIPVFGLAFSSVLFLHHYIWNQLHVEMHKPQGRWFSKLNVYKYLCRHHYLHHKHVNRNFNGMLPLFDWILGTTHTPSSQELRDMKAMGY